MPGLNFHGTVAARLRPYTNLTLRRAAARRRAAPTPISNEVRPYPSTAYTKSHARHTSLRRLSAATGLSAGLDAGGAHNQKRHGCVVPHFVDRASVDQIADQFVAMRSHGNQVTVLFLRGF